MPIRKRLARQDADQDKGRSHDRRQAANDRADRWRAPFVEPGNLTATTVQQEVTLKPGGQALVTAVIEAQRLRRPGARRCSRLAARRPRARRRLERHPDNREGQSPGVRALCRALGGADNGSFVVVAREEGNGNEYAAKAVTLHVEK